LQATIFSTWEMHSLSGAPCGETQPSDRADIPGQASPVQGCRLRGALGPLVRMPQWESRSPTSRLVAALVSLAVTVGLIATFRSRQGLPPPNDKPARVSVLLMLTKPAVPTPQRAAVPPQPEKRPGRRVDAPIENRPISSPPPETQVIQLRVETPQAFSPEASPASTPLRLDSQTLGRAVAGAEGSVRRMARNSGRELDTPGPSQSEELSTAVAQTGLSDCLAPNPGGSLFSIPIIAYMAVTRKCK
jgi:hypothetical protein